MEILKGTLNTDGNRASSTWQSRMRGCLVILIVPTLVALSLAALRPQAGIRSLQMSNANNAAVSPDGQWLAVATGSLKKIRVGNTDLSGYDKIDVLSTSTLNLIRSIQTPLTQHITFHPDNQTLAIVGFDHIIRPYRLADGNELRAFEGRASSLRSVIFSPDGTLLASNGPGKMIQIWRVSDGKVMKTLPTQANIDSIAFSPDGQLVAGVEAGEAMLWQIGDGREIRHFKENNVNSLSFSPDGTFLAIGTTYTGPGTLHGEVHVWNIKTNDAQPRWNFYHQDFVGAIAFDASGQYIAAGGYFATLNSGLLGDGDFWPARKIVIWRMQDGQRIQTIRTPHKEIYNLFFSPDGNTLISTGVDRNYEGNLAIWRVLPLSSWWDWLIPGSFVAALAAQMLWRRSPACLLVASARHVIFLGASVRTNDATSHHPQPSSALSTARWRDGTYRPDHSPARAGIPCPSLCSCGRSRCRDVGLARGVLRGDTRLSAGPAVEMGAGAAGSSAGILD